jgi:hypothetical protein
MVLTLEGDGCVDTQPVATRSSLQGEKFDSSSLR